MSNPAISPTAPQWSVVGMGVHTLTVAPFNVGDLLVLAFFANGGPATGVTGGGVTAWACAASYYDTTGRAYIGIWWGVVAATGPVQSPSPTRARAQITVYCGPGSSPPSARTGPRSQ